MIMCAVVFEIKFCKDLGSFSSPSLILIVWRGHCDAFNCGRSGVRRSFIYAVHPDVTYHETWMQGLECMHAKEHGRHGMVWKDGAVTVVTPFAYLLETWRSTWLWSRFWIVFQSALVPRGWMKTGTGTLARTVFQCPFCLLSLVKYKLLDQPLQHSFHSSLTETFYSILCHRRSFLHKTNPYSGHYDVKMHASTFTLLAALSTYASAQGSGQSTFYGGNLNGGMCSFSTVRPAPILPSKIQHTPEPLTRILP